MPARLELIERWMQSVIMHPGGVVQGMQSAAAREHLDVPADQLESVILPSLSLDSVERLEIYARAYYARLLECMQAEFPVLARAVGEELFAEFALGYLEQYPSRSYTLNHLGAQFADYLAETCPDDDGGDWLKFLVELARLEWAFTLVFDGPGAEREKLLDPEQLAAIPVDRWADIRLRPVPCLRTLALRYPIQDYYRSVREHADAVPPDAADTWLAITRTNYIVRHYPLTPVQFALLNAILEGARLGEAIEQVVSTSAVDLDELAGQLNGWFHFWTAEGFFLALTSDESSL